MDHKKLALDIDNILEANSNLLGNLVGRWQDERGTESITEYQKVIEKEMKLEVLKMHKRPFGFTFKHFDYEVTLKIYSTGSVKWSAISNK